MYLINFPGMNSDLFHMIRCWLFWHGWALLTEIRHHTNKLRQHSTYFPIKIKQIWAIQINQYFVTTRYWSLARYNHIFHEGPIRHYYGEGVYFSQNLEWACTSGLNSEKYNRYSIYLNVIISTASPGLDRICVPSSKIPAGPIQEGEPRNQCNW